MSSNESTILVGVSGNLVFIKVQGKGSFQVSQPLRHFSMEMISQGYREFVVDLAECPSMDSTFLGVLAGMGLRLQPTTAVVKGNGKVHLANLNTRCRESLGLLGIDRLSSIDLCNLRVAEKQATPPPVPANQLQQLEIPTSKPTDLNAKTNQAEVMLEAHRTLMDIDPSNVPKFKDCVRFLAEDLERLRAANTNTPS